METLAYQYSSESTRWELSNEYQHDRVKMIFKNLCVLVLWTKIASALEGLMDVLSQFRSKVYIFLFLLYVTDDFVAICILYKSIPLWVW